MSILLQRSSEPQGPGLVDNMRAAFRSGVSHRRNSSLTTVPPPRSSSEYSYEHAALAAAILYRSPIPSQSGLPIYILNAAAFPDAFDVDYDTLLGYVLDRLPGEDKLIAGEDYEVVFFAGGQPDNATSEKRSGPGNMWYLQAYQILSRAVRKRLHKLYVVHERSWVRVLIEIFGTIVSPKFKKKIIHVNTLSGLAMHLPIEQLLIPPSVYLHDRRIAADIYAPYVSGRRAFAADDPFPRNLQGERRLPRVLRETTTFLCCGDNLKTEGLFRIPPHSQLLSILKEAYDRGQKFVVWKEGPFAWAQPGMDPSILREVPQQDTYNTHLAAGLIKLWYRELKTPVFGERCYEEMKLRFPVDKEPTVNELADVFSPASTRSLLSPSARSVVTLHLLPLLDLVASHQAENKMSPSNLAICFAPALVCGSDQMADAKMISVIRRVLEAAIDAWSGGLMEACNVDRDAFSNALSPPRNPRDYEDPLHEQFRPQSRESVEDHRIVLQDQDEDLKGPPLPPRPQTSAKLSFPARQDSLSSPVKRKPAPPPSILPQYSSMAITEQGEERGPAPTSARHAHVSSFDSDAQEVRIEDISSPERSTQSTQAPTSPQKQSDLMRELKASLVTDAVKRKPVYSPTSPDSALHESTDKNKVTQQRSVSGNDAPSKTSGDGVFARPTWPASARQVSAPVVPQLQISTTSIARPTTPNSASATGSLSAPGLGFRARAPSAGLLKRMASMEAVKTLEEEKEKQRENGKLLPHRLGMKQASVDDLKRLYEERAGTVEKLNSASTSRRGSNVSIAGSRRGSTVSGI